MKKLISNPAINSSADLAILSNLVFAGGDRQEASVDQLTREQFQSVLELANLNHVVIRAFEAMRKIMADKKDRERYEWAAEALQHERVRIHRATTFLRKICSDLTDAGHDVMVIKSLDHWPDLGSDLDLYTDANPAAVIDIMSRRFDASLFERSWGDRLANKWNFVIPGLPELVEIHMGRLGQTGELINFANSLIARSRLIQIGNNNFRVTCAEDRLMICTLQRMYRHFFLRLCDIADTVELLENDSVNFDDLQAMSEESGIWEGVATFLVIVSDFAQHWRGSEVSLPDSVRSAARFGGDQIGFARNFLRVPIMPHSVKLYASEWVTLISQGKIRNTARLSLLPWLATAAAVELKITGSDKGIW